MTRWAVLGLLAASCAAGDGRPAAPTPGLSPRPSTPSPAPAGTAAPTVASPSPLGCVDHGIYADLDDQVYIDLPAGLAAGDLTFVIDDRHHVLVAYADAWPVKAYPTTASGDDTLALGALTVHLRAADAAELAPLATGAAARTLGAHELAPPGDRDDDGLPDPLDVLIGGKKLIANGAHYTGDYFQMSYPGGDAPRDKGSCADVVIRALRNAGVDLQQAIADDIAAAPAAYPMVKKPDHAIDHRRVRTMLPWFTRHTEAHGVDPRDATDPFRPGDVLFMDTLPGKPGPDHVGIVSDTLDADGLPLVINNWTDGTQDAEMDLLAFVPVVARFRLPPAR